MRKARVAFDSLSDGQSVIDCEHNCFSCHALTLTSRCKKLKMLFK